MLNAVLEDIYSSGEVCNASGETRPAFPTATREEDADLLAQIVAEERPKNTLEIGMAYGLSTVSIADALPQGAAPHCVIDPFQSEGWSGIGLHTVDRAGLSHRVEFIEEASQVALPRALDEGRIFDFVFHDGSHLFDGLLTDLYFINRMMPAGGVLLVDDLWMPAVRRAVSFLVTNLDYRVEATSAPITAFERVSKPAARFVRDPRPFIPLSITLFAGKVMKLRKVRERKRAWTDFKQF